MHGRMDAAVTVDAQNAPTATWKTAQNAVSHSAHTHYHQRALHTKNLTLPLQPAPAQVTRGAEDKQRVILWLLVFSPSRDLPPRDARRGRRSLSVSPFLRV